VTQLPLPIKKSVSLAWQGMALTFDVAQDLFSSYQVDRGSRLLLESLEGPQAPPVGEAADFGCGYGVLGIAWQAAHPGWAMTYVDRDALAVAFSRHNLARIVSSAESKAAFVRDIALPYKEDGYDLVLWNVPGKAGRPVIVGLLDAVLDQLAVGGVVAAVVVHPLAELFTDGMTRDDMVVTNVTRGADHTVVHIRRERGQPVARDPFEEGVFDRPATDFEVEGLAWRLTPVIGLPEYDSLDHSTALAARAMLSIRDDTAVARWMVVEPGAGHLALAASQLWPAATGRVYGRDALAIRTTVRAIDGAVPLRAGSIWALEERIDRDTVDLLVARLPEQAQQEELGGMLASFSEVLAPSGTAVLHGRSTEVARIDRLIRKQPGWTSRRPAKLRGFACMVARYSVP